MECRSALKKKRMTEAAPVGECPKCHETKPLIYKAHHLRVCSEKCRHAVFSRLYVQEFGWKHNRTLEFHTVAESATCKHCGKTFKPKRYDQSFCSGKCSGRWAYGQGGKGARKRARDEKRREEFNRRVGKCALCQTSHDKIRSQRELGIGGKTGAAKFHGDHIIPKSRGGTEDAANKRYLCWFCNLSRKDLDVKFDQAIAEAGKAFWRWIAKISRPSRRSLDPM